MSEEAYRSERKGILLDIHILKIEETFFTLLKFENLVTEEVT